MGNPLKENRMSLKVRKSVKADLEHKRPIFLILGLVLSLSLTYLSLEWSFAERSLLNFESCNRDLFDEEDWVIPITAVRKPILSSSNLQLKAQPDIIKVVTNASAMPSLNAALFGGFDEEGFEEIIDPFPSDIPTFHFTAVESKPIFKGCDKLVTAEDRFDCFQEKLLGFVAQNFHVNDQMMMFSSGEKVFIEFVIEKDGSVKNATIIRGEDQFIRAEAMRLVKSLPEFTPAKINGMPGRMSYMLPINVKLQ